MKAATRQGVYGRNEPLPRDFTLNLWEEIDHCHRCERDERAAADRAVDPAAKAAHLATADQAAARAWMLLYGRKDATRPFA